MALKVYYHSGENIKKAELFPARHIWESYNSKYGVGDCSLYLGAQFTKQNSTGEEECDAILFTPHAMILIEMKAFDGPFKLIEQGANKGKVQIERERKDNWVDEFIDEEGKTINSFNKGLWQLKSYIRKMHQTFLPLVPGLNKYDKKTVRGILFLGRESNTSPVIFDCRTTNCNYDRIDKDKEDGATVGLIYPVSNGETTIKKYENRSEKIVGQYTFWSRVKEIEDELIKDNILYKPNSDTIINYLLDLEYASGLTGGNDQFSITVSNDGKVSDYDLKKVKEFEDKIRSESSSAVASGSNNVMFQVNTARKVRKDMHDYERAIKTLEDALNKCNNDKDRNTVLAELGICEYYAGNKTKALTYFGQLNVKSSYPDGETCFECGKICYREGKREWALAFMKMAECQNFKWAKFYALAYERYPDNSSGLLKKYETAISGKDEEDEKDKKDSNKLKIDQLNNELRFWIFLNYAYLLWQKDGNCDKAIIYVQKAQDDYQHWQSADYNGISNMISGLYFYENYEYESAKKYLKEYYKNLSKCSFWYSEALHDLADCCQRFGEKEKDKANSSFQLKSDVEASYNNLETDERKTKESNISSLVRDARRKHLEKAKAQFVEAAEYSKYVCEKTKHPNSDWKTKCEKQYNLALNNLNEINKSLDEIFNENRKENFEMERREWLIGEWYSLSAVGILFFAIAFEFFSFGWPHLIAFCLPAIIVGCKWLVKIIKKDDFDFDLPQSNKPIIGNDTSDGKYCAPVIMGVTYVAILSIVVFLGGKYLHYSVIYDILKVFMLHACQWITVLTLLIILVGGPNFSMKLVKHCLLTCLKHFGFAVGLTLIVAGIAWAVRGVTNFASYVMLEPSERVEKSLRFNEVDSIRSITNWSDRRYVQNSSYSRKPTRFVVLTERNGILEVYGTNGYTSSGIPSKMHETISNINRKYQNIQDATLTESGRWLVAYGVKSVESENAPQEMLDCIKKRTGEKDTLRSATFNDKGDWIVVSTYKYYASDSHVDDWIRAGIKKYGRVQKAYIYDDCAIVRFENGIETAGRVPEALILALLKDGEWAYDIRCVGNSWSYSSKDGKRHNAYY